MVAIVSEAKAVMREGEWRDAGKETVCCRLAREVLVEAEQTARWTLHIP